MRTFDRFPARLQEAIVSRLGWGALREVQERAGAALLDGRNAVILAPTAGGKTEAAVFPILAELIDRPVTGVGAIYIAPLKALLNNQEERLGVYTEMVGLRRFVWHGDATDSAKRAFVREPVELLMTTPESLEVMLVSPRVPVVRLFGDLRAVIVDEVHAFAGTDRGAHLLSVIERLAPVSAHDIQRIGLSATVGNPHDILAWLRGTSTREGVVIDPPAVAAPRQIAVHLREIIVDLARDAARQAVGRKSLFFCPSRALTERIAERLRGHGTDVFVHHSSVSLEERRAAEERFHQGTNASIVCTSTLELGIDVGDLDLVFQANAPSTVSSFMQRMGRTGRRSGQVANTTFYCEHPEAVLQAIALVELAREGWVERVAPQSRCWPVLVHQILALTLQFGAISGERCWQQLSRVPDFAGITREEFDSLLAHLTRGQFLFEAGGLLSMGEQAERVFGRKNFLELYSVFSSPKLYRVVTAAGREIGSLEQDFVDRLVDEMSSFLLGGRAWLVEHVNHDERTVRVQAAPRGREPTWGGFMPQMLGYEICQRTRRILAEGTAYPYVAPEAIAPIQAMRDDLGSLLRRKDALAVQIDSGAARWWTFAGGRINFTLKHAVEAERGWRVVADNFHLRISGAGISYDDIVAALGVLRANAIWADPRTRTAILARLPNYRLSKFQPLLPATAAVELVATYLLDVPGTLRFLEQMPLTRQNGQPA